jgi:DNA-binding response OmpR family regulator
MSSLHTYSLGAIRMLLAEPNPEVRTSLRTSLFRYNLRGIDDCATGIRTCELLSSRIYDIAILDADMEDYDIAAIVRRLRERKVGRDPFLNMILIADPPHTERARHLVNAGADAILVRPISVQTLHSRIGLLIEKRHPFVVTHDYIGPERRTEPRPGTMKISEIPVPNSLSERAYGKTNDDLHFKAVDETWAMVYQQRVHRLIYQLDWLQKRYKPDHGDAMAATMAERITHQLALVAETLASWIGETANPELLAIGGRLKDNAKRLAETVGPADPKWFQAVSDDINFLDGIWSKQLSISQ